MARLVECIPNFSEGRRPEVIAALVREITAVSGVILLDQEMDQAHNRAVLTFVGEPQAVKGAAFAAIAKATELIDMEKHTGEHPRLGATDVVPFVPISDVSMEECVQLARELGQLVGEKLAIPVYLYEAAATRPDRENLADIRKGEYEGLKKEIGVNLDRKPDFGPEKMHPTAGAVVIGARMPLVAYNVYLGTTDVSIAKKIARAIRYSTGGLRYVKALGFEIKERDLVQVSMNLVNYQGTPVYRVMELIKAEANRYGVPIVSSELVGLAPLAAFLDVAEFYLKLENFKPEQILETRLMNIQTAQQETLADFIDRVASSAPTPGGGSVSALCASLGAALTAMVCRLTIGKKKFEAVQSEIQAVLEQTEKLRQQTFELIKKDASAFDRVTEAFKLPKDSEEQKAQRSRAIQEATKGATLVPLKLMEYALEIIRLCQIVVEKGNPGAASDAGVSSLLANAALKGAWLNVKINLNSLEDQQFVAEITAKAQSLRQQAEQQANQITMTLAQKI